MTLILLVMFLTVIKWGKGHFGSMRNISEGQNLKGMWGSTVSLFHGVDLCNFRKWCL